MDAELARSLWSYDADTGMLQWRVKPRYGMYVGDVAGCPNSNGHLQVTHNRKLYLVHRLVWLMSTGDWPKDQLDHVNGIRDDNRLINLREATHRQNCINRPCHRAGKARFTTYDKVNGRWQAISPKIDGKHKHLGRFDTMELASEAAERWLQENHPELV